MADAASLHMIDGTNGWAFGPHRLARTSDGANTFHDATPPGMSSAQQLDSPFFLDSRHAWVFVIEWSHSTLGSATLERTSDGGASWKATSIKPAIEGELGFIDSENGWMISGREIANHTAIENTLWRTADGGQTWSQIFRTTHRFNIEPNVQRGDCAWLGSIGWTSTEHGIAGVSCPSDARPSVEVTNDGGQTWTLMMLPQLPGQPGVALFEGVGPIHVFAGSELSAVVSRCVGADGLSCRNYGEVYQSSNGGATWSQGAVVWGAGDLVMSDAAHAWLPDGCLTDQCEAPDLLVTSDGGAGWQRLDLPQALWPNMHGTRFYSLVTPTVGFAIATNALAGTADASFFKTTDSGHTFNVFVPRLVPANA